MYFVSVGRGCGSLSLGNAPPLEGGSAILYFRSKLYGGGVTKNSIPPSEFAGIPFTRGPAGGVHLIFTHKLCEHEISTFPQLPSLTPILPPSLPSHTPSLLPSQSRKGFAAASRARLARLGALPRAKAAKAPRASSRPSYPSTAPTSPQCTMRSK